MRYYKVDNSDDLLTQEEIIEQYFSDPSIFCDNERTDEMLNDCYNQVTIAGEVFCPSEIVKQCDPNLYDEYEYEEAKDHMDKLVEDIITYLPRLEKEESIYIDEYSILYVYDDEEEEEENDNFSEEMSKLIG